MAEEEIFIWNRHNTILNFIILLKTVVFFFFLEKLDVGIMDVICGIEPDNDCRFVCSAGLRSTNIRFDTILAARIDQCNQILQVWHRFFFRFMMIFANYCKVQVSMELAFLEGESDVTIGYPGVCSSKAAGSDVIGIDLGTTNSCVAVMEGKVRT
jgi:hypothetical protein